jgi:pimeloyl-ACP methyl ester carboxylesterase
MAKPQVFFIHGMYMTPLCWEHWETRFQASGFRTSSPAWPGRDRPIAELRNRHPDPELGTLALKSIVEHLAAILRTLDEPPVLIGHSMGGLVTQLLLQMDLAAAGIVIHTAPPLGVFTTQLSFLKSNWPHITPFANQGVPIRMTFERFQYTFVNGMSEEDQRAAFDRYVVPESRRIPRQSLAPYARIKYKKKRAPLLFVAGRSDHIIPASLNRKNWRRYAAAPSETDFKEFPGRNHFTLGQPGWEAVADQCISWIDSHVNL